MSEKIISKYFRLDVKKNKQGRLLFIFALCFSTSSFGADIDCYKKNFYTYISAAKSAHSQKLEQMKDQPEDVQNAVKEGVEWQLSNLYLSEATFNALIKKSPESIDMNAKQANIYQYFLISYDSEGCSAGMCFADTHKLNGKADHAFVEDIAFEMALTQNNAMTKRIMRKSKEQKDLDAKLNLQFHTKEYFEKWMSSKEVKEAMEYGGKTFNELGCR